MKLKHLPSLIASNFQVAHCIFPNSRNSYSYKCSIPNIKVGDYCIVVTKEGPKIVEVVAISGPESLDYDADYDYRWIAQKVDLTWHDNIVAQEKELMKQIHLAERKKQLDEFINSVKDANPLLENVIIEHEKAITRL